MATLTPIAGSLAAAGMAAGATAGSAAAATASQGPAEGLAVSGYELITPRNVPHPLMTHHPRLRHWVVQLAYASLTMLGVLRLPVVARTAPTITNQTPTDQLLRILDAHEDYDAMIPAMQVLALRRLPEAIPTYLTWAAHTDQTNESEAHMLAEIAVSALCQMHSPESTGALIQLIRAHVYYYAVLQAAMGELGRRRAVAAVPALESVAVETSDYTFAVRASKPAVQALDLMDTDASRAALHRIGFYQGGHEPHHEVAAMARRIVREKKTDELPIATSTALELSPAAHALLQVLGYSGDDVLHPLVESIAQNTGEGYNILERCKRDEDFKKSLLNGLKELKAGGHVRAVDRAINAVERAGFAGLEI